MADTPWYAPDHVIATLQPPKAGEHVWTLRKAGRQVDCALRFHGESYGWECQCLHDGELAYGQRFVTRAGALAEAEAQRARLLREGWTAPCHEPSCPPVND